jgi:hypothetical protein
MDLVRNAPIDPKELKLFNNVKGLLVEAGYDLTESISVAAGVARTWSWYLNDVSAAVFERRGCAANGDFVRLGSGASRPEWVICLNRWPKHLSRSERPIVFNR